MKRPSASHRQIKSWDVSTRSRCSASDSRNASSSSRRFDASRSDSVMLLMERLSRTSSSGPDSGDRACRSPPATAMAVASTLDSGLMIECAISAAPVTASMAPAPAEMTRTQRAKAPARSASARSADASARSFSAASLSLLSNSRNAGTISLKAAVTASILPACRSTMIWAAP